MYAIPYSLYTKYGLRRYGFHGSSHRYVAKRACEILKKKPKDLRMITCHLGNGASMTAIEAGRSIDTSMGLTPVEGLIMGTRTGDLDLGVLTYIMQKEEIGINASNTLINKHSGMLGITGVSSDMREIITEASEKNNERAILDASSEATHRVEAYHYHHWADTPPRLLQENLAKALRNTGIATQVVTYSPQITPQYLIAGKIRKFHQVAVRIQKMQGRRFKTGLQTLLQ